MDMKQRARELLRRLEAAIAANQLVLPSLPEVVIRVRALTESGNCSVEESMLLRHWGMPEDLIQMARWHETVLRDNGRPLPDYVDVVIAANLMHYGTQKGRYARYAGVPVPALEKCLAGRNQGEPNPQGRRELVQLLTSE